MDDLLKICDAAVEMARSAGADEAEAYAVTGRRVDAELQKNDIQIAKSMGADGLGIRVFRGGSLGFAYVNGLTEEDARTSVERALGIAAAAPPDSHNGLPDPTPISKIDGIFDSAMESYGVEHAVEDALAMLHTSRQYDERVTIDGGGVAAEFGTKAIVSSKGVRAIETESSIYCYIMGMARDGEEISSFDYQFDSARSASGIDPAQVARVFAAKVVDSLGAVKGESFNGTVILAPKAAADIVVYPIEHSVNASAVQKGTSRFCDLLGKSVAGNILTVTDDAALPAGFATTSFDREGIAPTTLPLVENGVLRNYIFDSYTGRKDGRASNGHAGGGASSVPSVSTTNVVVKAGETTLDDMIVGTDRGVLVTRYSGNVDPVSGDFSGVVKGGHMIRGGKLAEPLSGTMIAGDIFELLPDITAVSRETERLFSIVVPYMSFDGVTVTCG